MKENKHRRRRHLPSKAVAHRCVRRGGAAATWVRVGVAQGGRAGAAMCELPKGGEKRSCRRSWVRTAGSGVEGSPSSERC